MKSAPWRGAPRHRSSLVRGALTALLASALLVTTAPPASAKRGVAWTSMPKTATGPMKSVIVRAEGDVDDAKSAVVDAGGSLGIDLPLIDGFAANIPASSLGDLKHDPAILSVTPNERIHYEQFTYDSSTTDSNFADSTGASGVWTKGNLGAGIGVAVIDTGVSPMNDLSSHVTYGPDLSGEGTYIDTYGHGTVMAGVIAGDGTDSVNRSNGAFVGMAPKANIVSVKVAGRNGVADVTTILQAMHWVAAYKDQYNIRVLNLSWGTASTQSTSLDPLNYAVERLWGLGIVVVVAAGNGGPGAGTITKPADDPVVLTAGAYDDRQDTNLWNDTVPNWSARGPTAAGNLVKPDLVSPGRTLIATRSYGSDVEINNSRALVGKSYIKGSGTSEATAVTSGATALLLAARPTLTPDQVKAVFKGTALPISGVAATTQGSGRLQLTPALTKDPGPASWQSRNATGLGSIEASRGGLDVETDCNHDGTIDVINGEIDNHCEAWDPAAWTGSSWTGSSWTGSSWTGSSWTGSSWTGSSWTGSSWTSAVYDDTYDEFLTAWWGNRPRTGRHIPGEMSELPFVSRMGPK